MEKRFLLVLAFTVSSYYLNAQIQNLSRKYYWVDGNLGIYNSDKRNVGNDGITFGLGLNYKFNNTYFKLRYLHQREVQFIFPDNPSESFNGIGGLLGKGFSGEYLHIYFLGGIGVTNGVIRGKQLPSASSGYFGFDIDFNSNYERIEFWTPTIPLEIEFTVTPIANVGFSLSFWNELNAIRSTYGFSLKVSGGKLR